MLLQISYFEQNFLSMKKGFSTWVVSIVALAAVVISCQKVIEPISEGPGSGAPVGGTAISSRNPVELSKAIKVWYGTRTNGVMPAPRGSSITLDGVNSPASVQAFAGRYAVIKPAIATGNVKGYYVSIPQSGQFFKIDYLANPRNTNRLQPSRRRNSSLTTQLQNARLQSNGIADSSIVIVLPSNIQTPDTFCVTYSAYDSLGNISNTVSTCVYVNALGGDAASAWLQNTFKITAMSAYDSVGNPIPGVMDTVIYAPVVKSSNKFCDWMNTGYALTNTCASGNCTPVVVNDTIHVIKNHISFGSNGAMQYEDSVFNKIVSTSLELPTCGTAGRGVVETYYEKTLGGWSYNSTTGSLLLIFDLNYYNIMEPEVWEYKVIKINNNHFLMYVPGEDIYIRWER